MIGYLNIYDYDKKELEKIIQDLPEYKQIQLMNTKSEKTYLQTLSAWYLLIKMCKEMKIEYHPDMILFSKQGKPSFIDNKFNFSLSHSDEYVVCIIEEYHVGIDLEKIKEVDINKAHIFASSKEIDYIKEKDSIIRFWEIWCKKEAYLKLNDLTVFELSNKHNQHEYKIHYLIDDYMIVSVHSDKK